MVFATSPEAEILGAISGNYTVNPEFNYNGSIISVLITGVGGISTAWAMQKWLCNNSKPDLAINAGIAGSFSEKYPPGRVVMPVSDCFADLGIEKDSSYQTLAEAGFMDPEEHPFKNGLIHSQNKYTELILSMIEGVKAVTVNTTSGSESSIERLRNKFNPDIETMEGATFFYICARENIPFLALRAISNMVKPDRNTGWEIPLALENLAGKMKEVLDILK